MRLDSFYTNIATTCTLECRFSDPLFSDDEEDAGFEDDLEDEKLYKRLAMKTRTKDWFKTGIFHFQWDLPEQASKLRIRAHYRGDEMGSAKSETTAHAAFSPKNHPKTSEKNEKNEPQKSQFFLQVRSSTKNVAVGHFAVFHVKCNFAFAFIDWLIVSKDVIVHRGRELGQNLHPEVKTFSVVVSSEMSPGFHILAYAVLTNNQLVSGAQHKSFHNF